MSEKENENEDAPKKLIDFLVQRVCPSCAKINEITSKTCEFCDIDMSKIEPIGTGDDISRELAITAIMDTDASVRKTAVDSLGDLGDNKVLGVLTYVLLNDPDDSVRKEAADEIGDLHHEYSIKALTKALKDKSQSVRKEAVEGLEKIKKKTQLKDKAEKEEDIEKEPSEIKKPERRTQGQLIQEALGLSPEDIQLIEKKFFIARFLDFFSEETLDFIYKDNQIDQYKTEINNNFQLFENKSEEDKLLAKSFESKKIFEIINHLKTKSEEYAIKSGFKEPIETKFRRISIIITLPMFVLIFVFMFLPPDYLIFSFPLLCIFCMLPQFLRASILKKWYDFKDQNKNQFYSENRDDIMILKGYTRDLLNNIRTELLDLKVPLQIIKFVLYSRDYDNVNLINQRMIKGSTQYFFSFEYPSGMEPFPIPEIIRKNYSDTLLEERRTHEKPEKNFIVLSDLKIENGVILNFSPILKTPMANKINELLNNCDFSKSPTDFNKLIPKYSPDMGIYCTCGEIIEIINVQICNWKNELKFYLFEGGKCNCGEKMYTLSLMNENNEIPNEFKDIFK